MRTTKIPKTLIPVLSYEDIDTVSATKCKDVYIKAADFLHTNQHQQLLNLISHAKSKGQAFYVCFDNKITDSLISQVSDTLELLSSQDIQGVISNNFDIIKLTKDKNINLTIFADSGLNIHNLAAVDMAKEFGIIANINITEEIYTQNLIKIRKFTKKGLSVDSDNIPWIAEELIKNKAIDYVVVKGSFKSQKDLLNGISCVEKILENPAIAKKKPLPFKNSNNFYYESNHFLGEFLTSKGNRFKFSENIKQHKWSSKRVKIIDKSARPKCGAPTLTLRINSLDHIKYLKKFINSIKYNPVSAIEYGEIINTADLKKYSFNKIIQKVKAECQALKIDLQLSTPRILIERDFDRVFEYVKELCTNPPEPTRLIANNSGYWWATVNDFELNNLNIELGQGISLNNSASALCFKEKAAIQAVDLSEIKDFKELQLCVKELKESIAVRKYTIAGNIRVPSLGLCPLNRDYAILSRLSCAAPCHNGHFAITDPDANNTFPFAVDGFCRMHLFKDKVLDLFPHREHLAEIGINEFVIDFSGLPPEFITILLTRYMNSLTDREYKPDENFQTNL